MRLRALLEHKTDWIEFPTPRKNGLRAFVAGGNPVTGTGEISRIEVSPIARHGGVGSQVVREFEAWAKVNGIRVVEGPAVPEAVPFFESMGYAVVGDRIHKKLPRPVTENDDEHALALNQTGFWGRQGAGCIFLSQATGRFGFGHRSMDVLEPNTFGSIGGALDVDESPEVGAEREAQEEVGYHGSLKLVPLDVFVDPKSKFRYTTFVAVVPNEFKARLNWENQDFVWTAFGQWPTPLHPGMAKTLAKPAVLNKLKGLIGVTESTESDEVLYHGTNVPDLTAFDMTKAKTAKHIYTTPDLDTAKGYGRFVYQVQGNENPQFNLDPYYEREEYAVFQKLYADYGEDYGFESLEEFIDTITGGQMYQRNMNQYFQNGILDELFSMGYRSVRMVDQGHGNSFPTSVVFNSPADVQVIKRII